MTTRRLWGGLGWFSRRLIVAFLAVVVVYGVLSSVLYYQTLDTKTLTAPRKSITIEAVLDFFNSCTIRVLKTLTTSHIESKTKATRENRNAIV